MFSSIDFHSSNIDKNAKTKFLPGSGSCPECQIPLKRVNFRVQMFEDAMVEKEIEIRKRVLRDFNKKEEDFPDLRSYNDYLEEVEGIVYNLANNIDVLETSKRIEQYKRENRDLIIKNKTKLGKRENELQEILEMERFEQEARRVELAKQEVAFKEKKMMQKEALLDELMASEGDARNILETYATHLKATKEEETQALVMPKATQFSTGVKFGAQQALQGRVPVVEEGPLYSYKPVHQEVEGPRPPTAEEVLYRGYIANVREETRAERAGGFKASIACLRALQEGMAGLYYKSSA